MSSGSLRFTLIPGYIIFNSVLDSTVLDKVLGAVLCLPGPIPSHVYLPDHLFLVFWYIMFYELSTDLCFFSFDSASQPNLTFFSALTNLAEVFRSKL